MLLEPRLTPDKVRELLVAYRAEYNLSLRELAAKIGGLTCQTLGNIERGAVWPKRTTLLKIERFLRRQGYLQDGAAA